MTTASPGRNDPCPCGSGRKYEACCLAVDRTARRAKAVGLTTVAGGANDEPGGRDEVWQTELVPFPATIDEDPDARLTVALVVSAEGPLFTDVHSSPRGEPEVVGNLLADAVLEAATQTGRWPARLEARYPEVVETLAARLGDRGVEVEAHTRLHPLDSLAGAMAGGDDGSTALSHLRPCFSFPQTWRAWGLSDEVVAELFAAGAAYYGSEAWDMLADDAPLELETADGRVWVLSVLGGAGIETGLAMYSDTRDHDRIQTSSVMPSVADFVGRCLSFTFDPVDEIPPPMRREVLLSGWTVAAPDAYPTAQTINTPGGGMSTADARDLTAALRALAAACDRLGGAHLLGESAAWKDPGTGVTLRLGTDPWSARRHAPTHPTAAPASVHRLRIALEEIEPPIWRRIEVPSHTSLRWLHAILQDTMGWSDYHLWTLEVDGIRYGEADPSGWTDFEDPSVPLGELAARPGARLRYVYDYGDHWVHEVVVEAVEAGEPGVIYPRCLDGARACPVEDCGGVPGYHELLEALRAPGSPEARELVEWAGADFDPEEFDLAAVNRLLARLQPPAELTPQCAARLAEVVEVLDGLGGGEMPPELLHAAYALLYGYVSTDPGSFLAARKAGVLAGAAFHAAGMLLGPDEVARRPTLEELAARFEVSTGAIASRSLAIRELLASPDAVGPSRG